MRDYITFRIYPERNRKLYFRVLFFRKKKMMYEFVKYQRRIDGGPKLKETYLALTTGWRVIKGDKRNIGQILFCDESIKRGSIISHECGHAALHWARRKKLKLDGTTKGSGNVSKNEERFCLALGDMARQITMAYYNRWIKK